MLPLESSARLVLPPPISTNNLFATVAARGGKGTRRVVTSSYKAWRTRAAEMLAAQGPLPRFALPVEIALHVGEIGAGGGADLDNTFKAYLDALVLAGVIRDDSRKWLRAVIGVWVTGMTGCVALIEPDAEPMTAPEVVETIRPGLRELLR